MDFPVPDGQLQLGLIAQVTLVCWCWDFSVVVALLLCFLVVVLTQEEEKHFDIVEFTKFSASRALEVFQWISCIQVCFEKRFITELCPACFLLPSPQLGSPLSTSLVVC